MKTKKGQINPWVFVKPDSLDRLIETEEGTYTLGETVADKSPNVLDMLVKKEAEEREQLVIDFVLQYTKTKREKQIITLLARGLSQIEIANKLGVSKSLICNVLSMFKARCGTEVKTKLFTGVYTK